MGLKQGQRPAARLCQQFAQAGQLRLPGGRIRALLQRCVALPEGLRIVRPGADKTMFHVEHSPIQPAPTVGRALLDQAVNPRIEYLHGEGFGELGQRAGFAPGKPDPQAAETIETQAQHREALVVGAPQDGQSGRVVADQLLGVASPERAPAAQQIDRFEDRSLSGAVGARDQIDVGMQFELGLLETAQALDLERQQAHGGPYRRMGMTTNFTEASPGARIRQLELESVRATSTVSTSMAARASSR